MSQSYSRAAKHFIDSIGIEVPVIGGPMYPCSNPELTAAVSEAGGIGILQPISLTYVHGHDFRQGIRLMRKLTNKPIGMNALIEKSSRKYQQRMSEWIDIALEEDVQFFVTSLGKPDWVVKRVEQVNGLVYHDVTERKWAQIEIDNGVNGLICVNNRAGGHAGQYEQTELFNSLQDLNVPLVCAGGVGGQHSFKLTLKSGFSAIQRGTRFIASKECKTSSAYKLAIIKASASDIVLSERVTGIPVSLINTKYVRNSGTRSSAFARWMLAGDSRKHWMRTFYALLSIWQLRKSSLDETGKRDFWQAGKSVDEIDQILSCADIIKQLTGEK
ncbi:MAG: nitronate monooxygenase [Gammaproteobacteria bacterium]|jgi:nitronate monooxygenase